MSTNKRRPSIFSKGKTLERFKDAKIAGAKTIDNTSNRTPDINNFKKEVESYLEDFGGSYNPDFGYEGQLDFQKRNQWGSILDYICGDSKDERVSAVIKTMKGK